MLPLFTKLDQTAAVISDAMHLLFNVQNKTLSKTPVVGFCQWIEPDKHD